MEGNPELGSQPNPTANIRMKYSPSQNVGTEAANMAPPEAIWSTQVPWRMAATTPIGTPITTIQTMVISARRMLVSAPSPMTDSTGA